MGCGWNEGRVWGGVGLFVGLEEGEVIERDLDLPFSCIVCFFAVHRGDSSDGSCDSCKVGGVLTVLAAMSAFSVPVIAFLAHKHVNPFCAYKEHPVYSRAYVL